MGGNEEVGGWCEGVCGGGEGLKVVGMRMIGLLVGVVDKVH